MPTILIADDYPVIVTMLNALFSMEGYTVRTVSHGADLVYQATNDPPDLILTDVEMPVVDGITATHLLRADPRTAHLPILVQSGDPTYQHAALAAGASRFFEKPASIDALLATVQQLLSPEVVCSTP